MKQFKLFLFAGLVMLSFGVSSQTIIQGESFTGSQGGGVFTDVLNTTNGSYAQFGYDGVTVGNYIEWNNINMSATQGKYVGIKIRYANNDGNNRDCDLSVNGTVFRNFKFPWVGATWDIWKYSPEAVIYLPAGTNTIRLTTNNVVKKSPKIDEFTLTDLGGSIYPAEDYTSASGTTANSNGGYTGTGYINVGSANPINGQFLEFSDVYSPVTRSYININVRYAVNDPNGRNCKLFVNGIPSGEIPFSNTGSWSTWQYYTFAIASLNAGFTTFRFEIFNTAGKGPNIDKIELGSAEDDYFRTNGSGSFHNQTIWQSSFDGTSWQTSGLIPYDPSKQIYVSSGDELLIDYNVGQGAAAITVNSGAKLSVADGQTLTLSSLTLKSDTSGTATYAPTGTLKTGAISVTGTTTVEQYLATTRNWYISSPVSNALAPAGYTYHSRYEPGGADAVAGWPTVTVNDPLTAGKGYTALPSTAAQPITFTTQTGGSLNDGDVTIPLTYSPLATAYKGYNLIGNPYPSHLSWTYAFTQTYSANIEPTIWYRTNSSGSNASGWSFVTFNPISAETVPTIANAGLIPPMQAFWVLAKDVPNNSITFTNAMRSHQTGNPLKAPATPNADRKKVRLQLSSATETDEALIFFDAAAQDGYDDYDSPKWINNSETMPDLYSKAGNEKLVINGLSAVTQNMELPLGFGLKAAGQLTFKATELSNFGTDTNVYLLDKDMHNETELLANTEYSFTTVAATANNESRFALQFRAPGVTTALNATEKEVVSVFVNAQNQLVINANAGGKYAIYNAMGQQIENGHLTTKLQIVNSNLQTGVYVVKVGNQSKRIIIK